MNPIPHPHTSIVLGAPPNWDHSTTECAGLPVAQVERDGMPLLESYWRPSAEELAALADGQPVVLQVVGLSHPVVSIGVVAAPRREGCAMTALDMIAEWRRGCSNVTQRLVDGQVVADHPEDCATCTRALIDAVEPALVAEQAKVRAEHAAHTDLIYEVQAHLRNVRVSSDSDELSSAICQCLLLLNERGF